MPGNTIGKLFKVTTFGESHGYAIGGIIDGCPPGLFINVKDIQNDLNKRRPNGKNYLTERNEKDKVRFLSGIFNNVTTGTSIGFIVINKDCNTLDYEMLKNIYRPSHADYTYYNKYKIRDHRGGGRSSGRETISRIVAGSIAKKYLKIKTKIKVYTYLSQIGNISCDNIYHNKISRSNFFFGDFKKISKVRKLIRKLKKNGDSIGGKITLVAEDVPVGLGEPVFDKLDADLSHSIMSIGGTKGIEIGYGFKFIKKKGSSVRDEMNNLTTFTTNYSGGILGGISSGQPIVLNVAFKPTSSINKKCCTIDYNNNLIRNLKISNRRHDPCIAIRAVPIVESMFYITIMDHYLRHKSQCNLIK
ncbi:MAG: chorismate synthase [Enterobacteriaceae bacterium]